ncbi:collagen alpha-6(vi) chain, partial [Plakobranchus ocellatus]
SGGTNLAAGLQYVRTNSFQPAAGGRSNAQKVVVIVADGGSDDPPAAYKESATLRKNGTIVVTVGVGSAVDATELANVASSSNYTVQVPDFDSLGLALDAAYLMTCDAINGVNPGKACEQRAFDLVLLLDTSASEGLTHFRQQTEFAADLASQFDIGPTKVQVAAATFGSDVYRQFYLNQYDDTNSVVTAIRRITYSGGATYTQLGLQYVRNVFFADGYGHRKGVPKVVIVATDGRSTDKAETTRQAEMLRNEGYIVYVVAIGNNLDLNEVNAIATDPSRVYQVQAFDDLQAFMPTLKSDLCFACGQDPADVVFVLDSSASEGPVNFRKQLYFAGNVTAKLAVGPNKVQVALVTFSTTAYNVFYLDSYDNKYDVLDAISRTRFISGSTHTDEALSFVRLNTLSTLHGRRLQAQPVVIVLTDGQSSLPQNTIKEAQLLKGMGAVVIAVGIGTNTDDTELSAIASDAAHKFNVNSFDFLFSIQDQIVKETCEGKLPTPAPHPECGDKPADIVFLMDASSSEGPLNFEKMKAFVADFASQFEIGPGHVQFSCVAFSTSVHVEFFLNDTSSINDLLGKISNIRFYGGTTMTDKALEVVRTDVLKPENGGRLGAADTVVLLTDGRSVVPADTRRQAQLLKDMGVNIITIGVGGSVDTAELENVASDVQHAFSVINFDALKSIELELVQTACEACTSTEAADILLIIDSSSDESAALFKQEMDFVSNLISGFKIGPSNMQFSLMTFATTPNVEFWFNTYSTKKEILDSLQTVFFTQGDTNTHEALKFAREYSYLPFHGTRPDKSQYVIVVTDGKAKDLNATIAEADLLKKLQVTIMAVGIGANADKAELEAIATDSSHVFIADNTDALKTIHSDITVRTCDSIFELKTTTAPPPAN